MRGRVGFRPVSRLRLRRAALPHDRRQVLRQQIERGLRIDAEVLRELLDLIASQRRLELLGVTERLAP